MTSKRPSRPVAERLAELFGPGAASAHQVLTCIESNPTRRWTVDDILDATNLHVVEILLIVARLTYGGLVLHDGVGDGYRSTNVASGELSRTA